MNYIPAVRLHACFCVLKLTYNKYTQHRASSAIVVISAIVPHQLLLNARRATSKLLSRAYRTELPPPTVLGREGREGAGFWSISGTHNGTTQYPVYTLSHVAKRLSLRAHLTNAPVTVGCNPHQRYPLRVTRCPSRVYIEQRQALLSHVDRKHRLLTFQAFEFWP